jgi:Leucine-rich repeat (LRR) protein
MPELNWVNLAQNQFAAIQTLSNLPNLQTVLLSGNALTNISGLTGLGSVTWLDVSSNLLSSLPAMSGMSGLQNLLAAHNKLVNVSGLSGLGALNYVDLSYNQLDSFPQLTGLPKLDWIVLTGNELTAAPNVAELTALTTLNLGTNDITDLSNLASQSSLRWLYLGGNNLQSINTLTNLSGLLYVDVRYNLLNLASGSQAANVVQSLTAGDVYVLSQPQRSADSTSLTGPVWMGGGQFQFTLSGPPGQVFTVETSTNLVTWSALSPITNTTGTTTFTDDTASGNARFFRLLAP